MSSAKNPLAIYKLLPGTNCGQCFLPSCLAFAAAVTSGSKKPADCPFFQADRQGTAVATAAPPEPYQVIRDEQLRGLQKEVAVLDLATRAPALGGTMSGSRLKITCLGKDFLIDSQGKVTSECHTHTGLTIPLLRYIVHSSGAAVAGRWVPFRELKGAPPMNALFEQRGEKRLQQLADSHTDLFDNLVSIFRGETAENVYSADTSVILNPLPRLPVLICYWQPEDELGSKLNIFFDAAADSHLPIDSIFELTIGMVMMFEKIAIRHC